MSEEKTYILIERPARKIILDEDPDGFVLHLDEHPSPKESVYLSRDDVRSMALAMLAALGESNIRER